MSLRLQESRNRHCMHVGHGYICNRNLQRASFTIGSFYEFDARGISSPLRFVSHPHITYIHTLIILYLMNTTLVGIDLCANTMRSILYSSFSA